jgi:hypothetical protein
VNFKLEMTGEEAIVTYFKVISRLSRGTEESHGNLSQDRRSPGRDLNPESSEYEVGVLTTRSRCSVPFRDSVPTFTIPVSILAAVRT